MIEFLDDLDGRMTQECLRRVLNGDFGHGYIEGVVVIIHEWLDGELTLTIQIQDKEGVPLAIYEPFTVDSCPCTTRFPMMFRMDYKITNALASPYDALGLDALGEFDPVLEEYEHGRGKTARHHRPADYPVDDPVRDPGADGHVHAMKHRGASVNFTIGRYGGFYRHHSPGIWRLCLGWLAITFFWGDFDDVLQEALECLEEKRKAERQETSWRLPCATNDDLGTTTRLTWLDNTDEREGTE